jgi:hypothetical protein
MFPRQHLIILLVKKGYRGKVLRREGREMRSAARTEVKQGLTAFSHNSEFYINLERVAFGEMMYVNVAGATLGHNFYVNIVTAA